MTARFQGRFALKFLQNEFSFFHFFKTKKILGDLMQKNGVFHARHFSALSVLVLEIG